MGHGEPIMAHGKPSSVWRMFSLLPSLTTLSRCPTWRGVRPRP